MFSLDAIVLKKKQIKDNRNIISLFSKEYGKISAWNQESKSSINVDIGNVYNFRVRTENKINRIDNFKTKNIINISKLGYKEINNILMINSSIEKTIPQNLIFGSIYDDYIEILKYLEEKEPNIRIYSLFMLRLLKRLGICNPPDNGIHANNFLRLFSIIDIYAIDSLMKIEGIEMKLLEEIDSFNTETLNTYLN